MSQCSRVRGGVLLVSGTTIGAAMLALPVSTGVAGFLPSLLVFVCVWLYLGFTGLLVLETTLWMDSESNMISMARETLGRKGAILSWVAYLFLLYSLLTAFLAAGSGILVDALEAWTEVDLPDWMGPLPLVLVFGYFVFRGIALVDWINQIFMGGLLFSYILLVAALSFHVDLDLTAHQNWSYVLPASFVVVTSFGYHIIIPSLANYLERNVVEFRKVILIGSAVPFFVYVLWEFMNLGIIPQEGPYGILFGQEQGMSSTTLVARLLDKPWISILARVMASCAIITTFLGVALSLSDCLSDGFNVEKTASGRLLLSGLTFIPPLLIYWSYPAIFLTALDIAGAFGVVILLALMPALMVWSGRYYQKREGTFQAPGGKLALLIVIALSVLLIFVKLLLSIGII